MKTHKQNVIFSNDYDKIVMECLIDSDSSRSMLSRPRDTEASFDGNDNGLLGGVPQAHQSRANGVGKRPPSALRSTVSTERQMKDFK